MTADHSSYDDLARERRDSAEYREGYAEAQRAFLIGQAVRERRLALGLSQTELAARAGMTQPALSRLEAGGVIPKIPLPERISAALDDHGRSVLPADYRLCRLAWALSQMSEVYRTPNICLLPGSGYRPARAQITG